jgi:hypothetical protein
MQINNSRKIETTKIFPYVAWVTVIIFAFFVYSLAIELRTISENLKITTDNLRQQEVELLNQSPQPATTTE